MQCPPFEPWPLINVQMKTFNDVDILPDKNLQRKYCKIYRQRIKMRRQPQKILFQLEARRGRRTSHFPLSFSCKYGSKKAGTYHLSLILKADLELDIFFYRWSVKSMNHIEGGWPAEVKVQFIEYRNKFIRKIVKEEMFVFTITKV